MMYLFDTNIFLEILLSQEEARKCKKILSNRLGHISISDFTLHSIGVILFRLKKEEAFSQFAADVLSKIDIVTLESELYVKLSEMKKEYNLDFDDAYQCLIAEEKGLTIVTMDRDFARIGDRVTVEFI